MNAELKNIFLKSLKAVNPGSLIKSIVSSDCNQLKINEKVFEVNNNCFLIGFGKAVYEMAVEIENILEEHLREGIISIPFDFRKNVRRFLKEHSVIRVIEGAKNNLPDENSLKASIQIKELAEKCKKNDLLIILISGGGSALLSYPTPPITVDDKVKLIKLIASAGADIKELNLVRIALSKLKGGKLAALAYPATVVSFILSDIVRDPLDFIASGPTVLPNKSTNSDALLVLKKYKLMEALNDRVKEVLFVHPEKKYTAINHSKEYYSYLHNIVIGNNLTFLNAAKNEIKLLGYSSIILSNQIDGSIAQVSDVYFQIIEHTCLFLNSGSKITFLNHLEEIRKQYKTEIYVQDMVNNIIKNMYVINNCYEKKDNLYLIAGGEPTITITGNGTGGRNQELTLKMAFELQKLKIHKEKIKNCDVLFMCVGTDGIDGPTDAAGAIAYTNLIDDALTFGLNPKIYLENNDSNTFFTLFKNGSYLVKTGHTGTNVMDAHFVLFTRV